MIITLQPGFFTTVQDEGRWGYQAYGMPVSGAMDKYAFQTANILAGNLLNAAVFEMTGEGAAFRFDEEQLVAVCGADMQGTVNGIPFTNWSSFYVARRGEIRFNAAVAGYRTYMAVCGGIDVPLVLGSRSTYTRAGIGGYAGRTLRPGDVLYVGKDNKEEGVPRLLPSGYVPKYASTVTLRVLLGPQAEVFSHAMIEAFLNSSYTVTQAARTGYQLSGKKILTGGKADIISEAVGLGAILIPSYGLPFIVTRDHGTSRGFAKIGYVVQADLEKLVQAKPSDSISFTLVTEEEALAALREERQRLSALQKN